jgi:hypothetical protein
VVQQLTVARVVFLGGSADHLVVRAGLSDTGHRLPD